MGRGLKFAKSGSEIWKVWSSNFEWRDL